MFSTTTQYALRALVTIVDRSPERGLLTADLAIAADVPQHYLSKILTRLTHAGILRAKRGVGGGYFLQRAPGKIRLIEVVGLFEPALVRSVCILGGNRRCGGTRPCQAHHAFLKVKKVHRGFLETISIGEISYKVGDGTRRPRGLQRLLRGKTQGKWHQHQVQA